jgi:RNA polymerase sigma factor (sigma-70 family)
MIRAEIRFKNSAFMSALERNGYKSVAEFSRQSGINYFRLIDYANLKLIPKDEENKQTMMKLLNSDKWTLFEQYREVVERENGVSKIVTDIPVDKIVSLESNKLLQLESPDGIDESMIKESLEMDISAVLETLKDRESKVLKMYFGIDIPCPLDLDEIAEEVGLSRERVRQIKEKAVRRLRHRSRSDRLKPYMGHNRLKRLEKERREENQRREKYMKDNNINWWDMAKLDKLRDKPWDSKQ